MPSDLIRGWISVRVKKTRQNNKIEPRLVESEPKGLIQPQGCTIRLPAHAKGRFNPQTKTPPFAAGSSRGGGSLTGSRVNSWSGRNALFDLVRFAQHVAAAPHGFDEVAAFGGVGELLAQLADEDVDDLQFGLIHAAIEMVEEHFLGQGGTLAEREQLQHLVFLAGQMDALASDLDGLGVEIDHEIAGLDHRLGVALGTTHDGMDTGDQLVLVERLGHVIVGADAETLDLVLDTGEAGEDQNRCLDLGHPKLLEHIVTGHVGQIQVEKDNVVIVKFSEIDTLLSEVGRIDVETLGFEHQFDRLRDGAVIFYQQYAHASPLMVAAPGVRSAALLCGTQNAFEQLIRILTTYG